MTVSHYSKLTKYKSIIFVPEYTDTMHTHGHYLNLTNYNFKYSNRQSHANCLSIVRYIPVHSYKHAYIHINQHM